MILLPALLYLPGNLNELGDHSTTTSSTNEAVPAETIPWLPCDESWVSLIQGQGIFGVYPLVMTNSSPWYRWSIEIDGLPNLKMVDLSMAMLNNQMANLQNGATRLLIWFMTPIKFGL